MAEEIVKLARQIKSKEQQIIVISGHEEGIITFGKSIKEAGNILVSAVDN